MVARATAVAIGGSSAGRTRTIARATGSLGSRSGIVSAAAGSASTGANRTAAAVASTGPVELLGGLVRARHVTARLQAVWDGPYPTFRDDGSCFSGLHVAGYPHLRDDPAPDTRLVLAGVGTLRLRHLSWTGTVAELCMIHLTLEPGNQFGLPSGSRCVGSAQVSLSAAVWHR